MFSYSWWFLILSLQSIFSTKPCRVFEGIQDAYHGIDQLDGQAIKAFPVTFVSRIIHVDNHDLKLYFPFSLLEIEETSPQALLKVQKGHTRIKFESILWLFAVSCG